MTRYCFPMYALILSLCLCRASLLVGQDSVGFLRTNPGAERDSSEQNSKSLKRDFIGIELGQTVDEFRRQISRRENKDVQSGGALPESYYYFLYDLYVSEIEDGGKPETLVEVFGNGFVDKGLFQFAVSGEDSEPKLIAITVFLDPQWSSYDGLFQKLSQDYGGPKQLNPQRSIWGDDQTVVTLEKQLRYKIIDKGYLDELRARSQEEFDLYQHSYEEFLKKF
ncbi:hypothetical protein P0082_04130 [Candidatus Haliotispira prima]|uniref:DUF4375 domain-containing protein n=1 Tax=Candidatus Haliotispira prima TaxID=3034016 RepID=A0ABY8MJ62_9SPIO|nr:hypothetical protein P0082_04130 [Candidatus Haliotispira prima]